MVDLNAYVRDIPDFPKPGIVFKDITPLLRDPRAFGHSIAALKELMGDLDYDAVVGIESRGFMFGAALARETQTGFVPVRKKGKLPAEVVRQEYSLEYGTDVVEMHRDALKAGDRVVIIDDLVATGGTAAATCALVEQLGAQVLALGFVISLDFLPWKSLLDGRETRVLLPFS